MAVEEPFALAAQFPAGGSFRLFLVNVYAGLVGTGLTYAQALDLAQFKLDIVAQGGVVPAASPGNLIVRTASGIAALTAPEQAAINTELGNPLPPVSFPTPIAEAPWLPQSYGGTTHEFLVGSARNFCYWEGLNWRFYNATIRTTPLSFVGIDSTFAEIL